MISRGPLSRRPRMQFVKLLFLTLIMAVPAGAADRAAAEENYRQGNELFDGFRFGDAAAAYERAIGEDPKYLDAYFNRALAEEMTDRAKALRDWNKFVEVAGDAPDYVDQIGQANARIQILSRMPEYPEGLQPSHYVSSAGDYYREIAEESDSRLWRSFPVRVSMGPVPSANWAQGVREAIRIWKGVFPLELTADPDDANIIFDWSSGTGDDSHAGEEQDWVQFHRADNDLTGRTVAFIRIQTFRNWSKDEMRAVSLHEMGHALGIKGHSESKGDIMYFQMQEKARRVYIPNVILPIDWKSLVSMPSQRDLNTLIRLYNAPGSIVRLK